jgi:hypothetical protein
MDNILPNNTTITDMEHIEPNNKYLNDKKQPMKITLKNTNKYFNELNVDINNKYMGVETDSKGNFYMSSFASHNDYSLPYGINFASFDDSSNESSSLKTDIGQEGDSENDLINTTSEQELKWNEKHGNFVVLTESNNPWYIDKKKSFLKYINKNKNNNDSSDQYDISIDIHDDTNRKPNDQLLYNDKNIDSYNEKNKHSLINFKTFACFLIITILLLFVIRYYLF